MKRFRFGAAAVLTAVVASACCWLPLAFIALGVGAGGIGAWFEPARPYLLVATAGLLAVGFHIAYRRPVACAAARRRMRIGLWAAAVVAAGSFAAPYASRAMLARDERSDEPSVTLAVRGMTCPACAVRVQEAVADVRGVESVVVTMKPPQVRVWSEGAVDGEAIEAAVRAAGFEPGSAAASVRRTAHVRVAGMVQQLGIT